MHGLGVPVLLPGQPVSSSLSVVNKGKAFSQKESLQNGRDSREVTVETKVISAVRKTITFPNSARLTAKICICLFLTIFVPL